MAYIFSSLLYLFIIFNSICTWGQNTAPSKKKPDKTSKQTNKKKKSSLTDNMQKFGIKAKDPTNIPFKFKIGNVQIRNEKEELIWIATQGVYIYQEQEGKLTLELYCDQGVIWIPRDKENNNTLIYGEGNVKFIWGGQHLSGEQIYFDMGNYKGVVMEGTLRGALGLKDKKQTPLFLRAKKLMLHSQNHIHAQNSKISTCQFAEPHYHFAVRDLDIVKDQESMYVQSRDNTLYVGNTPLFFVPYIAGESLENWPLRSISFGNSSRFGNHLLTLWGGNVYKNDNFVIDRLDWELRLDVYEERGLGFGPGLQYGGAFPNSDSTFEGVFRTYYINDQPLDELGDSISNGRKELLAGERGDDEEATFKKLYRFYFLHRQKLPYGWLLDAELSRISDEELLFDFFEDEAREEKQQETYIHLRKYFAHNQMVSALSLWNLNTFEDRTVFLPRVRHNLIREPLFYTPLNGSVYYSSDIEVANVRREDDERNPSIFDEQRIFRTDWNNTLNYSFSLSEINFLPFVAGRMTYFEKDANEDFNTVRAAGTLGIDVSTNFYRLYHWQSDFLNVHNVLHIFTPQIGYRFTRTNVDPEELIPFDEVDTVADDQQIQLRLINRLKTHRLSSKENTFVDDEFSERPNSNIQDFFLLEAELSYFPDRDGSFRERLSNLELDLQWRIHPKVNISGNMEYNLQIFDIETAFTRIRMSPYSGFIFSNDLRYTREINLIYTSEISYAFSRRWQAIGRAQYDLFEDELLETTVGFRRVFHRFALDIFFEQDEVDDEVGVSVAFTPLDFAEAAFRN